MQLRADGVRRNLEGSVPIGAHVESLFDDNTGRGSRGSDDMIEGIHLRRAAIFGDAFLCLSLRSACRFFRRFILLGLSVLHPLSERASQNYHWLRFRVHRRRWLRLLSGRFGNVRLLGNGPQLPLQERLPVIQRSGNQDSADRDRYKSVLHAASTRGLTGVAKEYLHSSRAGSQVPKVPVRVRRDGMRNNSKGAGKRFANVAITRLEINL